MDNDETPVGAHRSFAAPGVLHAPAPTPAVAASAFCCSSARSGIPWSPVSGSVELDLVGESSHIIPVTARFVCRRPLGFLFPA